MRRFRIVAAAIALAAVPTFAVATPAAADEALPVLVDIEFTPDAVAVSGLGLAAVTVRVHLTDPDGVVRTSLGGDGDSAPFVSFQSSGGAGGNASLDLVSGTPEDGVWGTTFDVPSTLDGEVAASQVVAYDKANHVLNVDPRGTAAAGGFTVDGTRVPTVTPLRFVPDPVLGDQPFRMVGRFTYRDTGAGIGNQPLRVGYDSGCLRIGTLAPTPPNARTGPDGRFSFPGRSFEFHCVWLTVRSVVDPTRFAIVVATQSTPRFKNVVSAAARDTTVAVGARVVITGAIAPRDPDVAVHLQQRRDGRWRIVDSASTVAEGRFTLATRPSAAGTYRYRVVAPHTTPELGGASADIVVIVGGGGAGGGELPITGSTALPLAAILLLIGTGLVTASRRRAVRTRCGTVATLPVK